MQTNPLQEIITVARSNELRTSRHYEMRQFQRPTPDLNQVKYLLCDDEPMVLTEDFHRVSYVYKIWGIMDDGRVGHICISAPPDCNILTAYWPDLQPHIWRDANYIEKV